jgi:hypothetical protein
MKVQLHQTHYPNLTFDVDPAAFQHVFWLGGSPCSGKSTVSEILSNQYGIDVYHVDEAFLKHSSNFTPEQYPTGYKWTHTSWNDLWMQPQYILFEEAVHCYSEHLQFIFSDLQKYKSLIIAEGTSLLPDYINPLTTDHSRAMWMVPTEEFQRKAYPKRGPFVNFILNQCDNPEQALQNWMDRDVRFARWIEVRTHRLGLQCIQVDGNRGVEENAALVASHFQLSLL